MHAGSSDPSFPLLQTSFSAAYFYSGPQLPPVPPQLCPQLPSATSSLGLPHPSVLVSLPVQGTQCVGPAPRARAVLLSALRPTCLGAQTTEPRGAGSAASEADIVGSSSVFCPPPTNTHLPKQPCSSQPVRPLLCRHETPSQGRLSLPPISTLLSSSLSWSGTA